MIDRSLNYGRHLVRRFLAEAGDYHDVLDVGAGLGYDLRIARELRPDAALQAVEVEPDAVARLREQGIRVHALDVERQPLPLVDESIDVVLSNQTLEHVKELFWILHEISRVLRPGGTLIIGVPNIAALHNRLLLLLGRQPTQLRNASAHVRGYTRGDLQHLFTAVFPGGYRLVRWGGSNFYPFPPVLARPLAAAFPGMAWGIFLMLRKERPYGRQFLDYPAAEKLQTNFFLG
ncbi:MAG TPA: class I SAM-dependent methyltransferase [Longimicrobiaceae bacterium]|nr:class I SAM-dependent methyltransferase [Longimicrobiaceae bacterium]